MRADQKISVFIHTDNDVPGNTTQNQNIKDGYREKHEVQTIVLSNHKQSPSRNFDPSIQSFAFYESRTFLSLHKRISSIISYKDHAAIAYSNSSDLLLFHRLNV